MRSDGGTALASPFRPLFPAAIVHDLRSRAPEREKQDCRQAALLKKSLSFRSFCGRVSHLRGGNGSGGGGDALPDGTRFHAPPSRFVIPGKAIAATRDRRAKGV